MFFGARSLSSVDDRLHRQLAKLREQAAGTEGIQPEGWECLVLPSGKRPMYHYHLKYHMAISTFLTKTIQNIQ